MRWQRWAWLLAAGLAASQAWGAAPAACRGAADSPACQYAQAGAASCSDVTLPDRPACHQQFTPPANCRRERDRAACIALQQAQYQCSQLLGLARRQCLAAALPAPSCRPGTPPERCRALQLAAKRCGALFGSQRRQCQHQIIQQQDDGSALR
ncbi:hypothetical protein ACFOLG_11140 [Vogesella facilis]|uniref:Uncharacterized protein n=1 Tax=Vogesella facilis TaxID=1655232 RepID=A0ABV7RH53_9NEIS